MCVGGGSGICSDIYEAVGLEVSAQAESVRLLAHESNHVRNVLIEGQAEQFRAGAEVIAFDAPGECLVFHPLDDRWCFEVENASARAYERCRRDESRHL